MTRKNSFLRGKVPCDTSTKVTQQPPGFFFFFGENFMTYGKWGPERIRPDTKTSVFSSKQKRVNTWVNSRVLCRLTFGLKLGLWLFGTKQPPHLFLSCLCLILGIDWGIVSGHGSHVPSQTVRVILLFEVLPILVGPSTMSSLRTKQRRCVVWVQYMGAGRSLA